MRNRVRTEPTASIRFRAGWAAGHGPARASRVGREVRVITQAPHERDKCLCDHAHLLSHEPNSHTCLCEECCSVRPLFPCCSCELLL